MSEVVTPSGAEQITHVVAVHSMGLLFANHDTILL
jgi:hypothetical protein